MQSTNLFRRVAREGELNATMGGGGHNKLKPLKICFNLASRDMVRIFVYINYYTNNPLLLLNTNMHRVVVAVVVVDFGSG